MDAAINRRRGVLLILAAAVLWGTLGPAFRGLLDLGATPIAIGLWRAVVACPVVGLVIAVTQPSRFKVAWHDIPLLMGYGFISVALFFVVYALAVQIAPVAVAAVLLYTAPAWVIVLAAFLFRETVTWAKGAAVVLTFVGVALVAGVTTASRVSISLDGILAGLGAGLTYATFGLFGKAALRTYDAVTTIFYGLLFGMIFLLPVVVWREWNTFLAPLSSVNGWLLLAYMGILPTAGSFWLYMAGLNYLKDAGRASVLATLEPVVAAVAGYLLLGEQLSGTQLVGGALVLAGIVVSAVRIRRNVERET